MPQLFLRVCPETLQLGGELPDGQPPGVLVGVGGERCREGRLLLRFFPVGVDCLQQLDDLPCHQTVTVIVGVQSIGAEQGAAGILTGMQILVNAVPDADVGHTVVVAHGVVLVL